MLPKLEHCPYCGQRITNILQTMCYNCGYFILVFQILEEKKKRSETKNLIVKEIEEELEMRIRRGESEDSLIREYRDKIRLVGENIKKVIDEGFTILENRERYLRYQSQLSEDECKELKAINDQMNELAIKGGYPFKIRLTNLEGDPKKVITPLSEAAKGALRGLDKSKQHSILSAIAGFLDSLQKTEIDQKEKTRLEKDLDVMQERMAVHGAAIKSRRELEEILSENILQLEERLRAMGFSRAERVRRVDEFLNSLYEQNIIDRKEPYN